MVGDLYLYGIDTGETQLIKNHISATLPAWSNDSKHFVFSDYADIYIYDVATGSAKKIVSGGGYLDQPDGVVNFQSCQNFIWSRDDLNIIYKYIPDYFDQNQNTSYFKITFPE